jgi:hypothetical protein
MRPKPITTTVLPSRSDGIAFSRSDQRFPFTSASSSAPRLASAIIMNRAASATDGELAVPTVISGTPRLLSAARSMASKPTPRRVTTRMSPAESSSSSPNRVGPSVTAWTGACSRSRALKSACEMPFGNDTTSMSLRLSSSALPLPEKVSVVRTLFLLVVAVAIAFPSRASVRRRRAAAS